jgi:aromatic ring-opening dioxygenase LigB subunit
MAQHTAVEWLWDLSLTKELSASDFEQAKEMEKQQIEDAWKAGYREALAGMGSGKNSKYNNAEQYYTQTYGK